MANLVECKACGKEIAKGVKKCPHCGKDQRNWFMRHKILSFIGVIILISIIGGIASGGNNSDTNRTSTSSGTKGKTETIYKVNQPITVNENAEVVITKVEQRDQVGSQYVNKKASEGGTLIAAQLTVKNISDKPLGPLSTPSFNLLDEKGTKYDADIDATSSYAVETDIDNSKIASDLNPGIKVTDVQVFEISKDLYAKGKWYILISNKEKVQIK